MNSMYIAATGQHVGKTTSTLGLVASFRNMGVDTGYCKPVGQKHLTVDGKLADKDAVLFSSFIGFEMFPELHSPVILGRGVTKKFLDNPEDFHFERQLDYASRHLEEKHELVIYEGTGHPGVGSIVNLSNADVANRLNSGVVMVVEGGIGRTLDKLIMSMALFREQKVPLIGVIVNKVRAGKLDEVGYYLSKKLKTLDIPILGLIPYDQTLSYPIMETISQAVEGKVILNGQHLSKRVEDIVSGSLVDMDEFSTFNNTLLVVSERRLNEAIEKVSEIAKMKNLEHSPISGVIVTGDGRHMRWYNKKDFDHPYFKEHKVPVITTKLDTLGSVVKISRIEVKINTRTPWKIKRAIALIRKHVDFDLLKERMEYLSRKRVQ